MNIKKDINDLKRTEEILSALVKYELGYFVDLLKMKHIIPTFLRARKNAYVKKDTNPQTIKKILEDLGGAFIKLGQFLSLRPDLIPIEYCKEFKKLDDEVKPFNGEEAKKIAEKKLGNKLIYFNKKAIASGSVAQVHESIVENKKLLLKIKRPDADIKFSSDIDILKVMAKLLNSKFKDIVDLNEIVNEFEIYTNKELNLNNEAKNIQQFYDNFKEDKNIIIPKAYLNYCSENIIAMEYLHGIKFNKVKKLNYKRKRKIVKNYADAVFKQIFIDKFFHADPHPGNLLLMKNDKIAFIDFGIVGEISEAKLLKLKDTFISMFSGDAEQFTNCLINLGVAKKNINKEQLTLDLKELLRDYYDKPLENINLGIFINNAFHVAKKNHLHIPTDLILLGKSLITVEGVCAEIDPKFNIVESYKPQLIEMEKNKFFGKIKSKAIKFKNLLIDFPEKADTLMKDIKEVDESMKEIDEDLKNLNSNIRYSVQIIGLSLLFIGLLVSSVILMNFGEPIIGEITLLAFIGFILTLFFLIILLYKLFKTKKI